MVFPWYSRMVTLPLGASLMAIRHSHVCFQSVADAAPAHPHSARGPQSRAAAEVGRAGPFLGVSCRDGRRCHVARRFLLSLQRMFSRRTAIADGEFGRFSEAVRERREQGAQLLDLTQTNPTQAHIAYDWHALRRALNQAPIEMYAPDAAGDVRARQAIVTHLHPSAQLPSHGFVDIGLSERYRSERLVLTSSTSEAYTYLFKLLCDPGDVVLVPEPSYPLFEQLARYESVQLVGYRREYDGAWHIDAESLRSGLQRRPKAVVLVTPNNPTGSCASAEELAMLGDSGIPLIVDQVFAPFVRQRASSQAGMVLETERGLVFVLDGLSKRCGLPQLKL